MICLCSYFVLQFYIIFIIFLYLLGLYFFLYFFFFSSRRRHTRLQGDWSSDVCSSDLARGARVPSQEQLVGWLDPRDRRGGDRGWPCRLVRGHRDLPSPTRAAEIGRASCRERV